MLKSIIFIGVLGFASVAFADPACVSGTNTSNGDYDEICGVVSDGGSCYSGTNIATGDFEEVCGAIPDLKTHEDCCPAGDVPFAGQPCCDGNIADPEC